jgi:hypothetical protein
MKKLLFMAATALMLLTTGCKTTEQDYQRAYDRTIAANDSTRTDFKDTVYGRYRRAVRDEQIKVGNDTIDTRIVDVSVTKDTGATNSTLKRYCVVAAEFKQLFNAKSMQDRLIEQGNKDAFITETAEPFYYILAGSYDTLDEALAHIKRLRAQQVIKFKEPAPYVMQPARLR